MSIWVNIYPPIEEGDFPVLRRFKTEEEALQHRLEGCLKTIRITY